MLLPRGPSCLGYGPLGLWALAPRRGLRRQGRPAGKPLEKTRASAQQDGPVGPRGRPAQSQGAGETGASTRDRAGDTGVQGQGARCPRPWPGAVPHPQLPGEGSAPGGGPPPSSPPGKQNRWADAGFQGGKEEAATEAATFNESPWSTRGRGSFEGAVDEGWQVQLRAGSFLARGGHPPHLRTSAAQTRLSCEGALGTTPYILPAGAARSPSRVWNWSAASQKPGGRARGQGQPEVGGGRRARGRQGQGMTLTVLGEEQGVVLGQVGPLDPLLKHTQEGIAHRERADCVQDTRAPGHPRGRGLQGALGAGLCASGCDLTPAAPLPRPVLSPHLG